MSQAFTGIQKIRFDDVDGAGIVYSPESLHLCHATFEDFFGTAASLSYPALVKERRLSFPTVAIQSEFQAPFSYGEAAFVTLTVKTIGRFPTVFIYDILRERDGALCFQAEVTTVLVNLDMLSPLPIEAELREIFEKLLRE